MECDAETGSCQLPPEKSLRETPGQTARSLDAVHYIGDPMCSWCWGISPVVTAIAQFCESRDIAFSMTMGGLRAGGGDTWNEKFKGFLENEWKHIGAKTGQPFGFGLLDRPEFNYDTEPACRAIVTVQMLQQRQHLAEGLPLRFFSAVQRKFYVDGHDPKEIGFYRDICDELAVDFAEFSETFSSPSAIQATQQAFAQCRQWGVRSFPTLLIQTGGELRTLANGYVTEEAALQRLIAVFGQPDDTV